jgi:hypothetical protein
MKMENVVLNYPPEIQELFTKLVAELAKANEKPEPKPVNIMFLWLDFYRIAFELNSSEVAAEKADNAIKQFRNRYPEA